MCDSESRVHLPQVWREGERVILVCISYIYIYIHLSLSLSLIGVQLPCFTLECSWYDGNGERRTMCSSETCHDMDAKIYARLVNSWANDDVRM